ncbi:hypothetical protein ABZ912_37625 [Nonomuraea angiospora]|uniref:hypothetical protein n=1 Tax=Nonomuraea angiospora TaxID=46172 RepID=UPI0033D67D77
MEIKDRQSGAIKPTKIEAAQEPCPVVVPMAAGSCLKSEGKSVVATVDIRDVGG